jgi:ubiquinone/menaquinone biosynthesis C-methylase UbiE
LTSQSTIPPEQKIQIFFKPAVGTRFFFKLLKQRICVHANQRPGIDSRKRLLSSRLRKTVHPQLLDALIAYSGAHGNYRVLELGCGTGNYIRAVSERTGCAGWGVDSSAAMLAQARLGISRRLHWVCAKAAHTGLGDAQFDLTFCVDVVHHLNNRIGVFEEVHRVLQPGGVLCLATDSENIIRSREPL